MKEQNIQHNRPDDHAEKNFPELEGVKYLLKIGKKEHLNQFAAGSLYCSNAITFWKLEEDMGIKGRGDRQEAGTIINAQKGRIISQSGQTIEFSKSIINIIYHPLEHVPVFCMFAIAEDECDGEHIRLSPESKETIKSHFPNADSVAIVSEPKQFVRDVIWSAGMNVQFGMVHYFYMADALQTNDGKNAVDLEYFKYLSLDTPQQVENGNITCSFDTKFGYRALFCKDKFFEDENEFRIVFPDESIDEGKSYDITFTENINVIELNNLLR